MNAVARQGKRAVGEAVDLVLDFIPLIVIAVVVGVGAWQLVEGVGRWHRGIYAGFHYEDAKAVAINALVVKYGRDDAARLRLGSPPVVNSHSQSLLVAGQVRVFHLVGPRGTRYCVSVWNPRDNWAGSINIGGDAKIEVGCTF